jgi:hypothetical protein
LQSYLLPGTIDTVYLLPEENLTDIERFPSHLSFLCFG